MRTRILFVLMLVSATSIAVSTDSVTMKNGDVFRGEIVEQVINEYVQIKFADGNEKRLAASEIQSIKKEESPATIEDPSDGLDEEIRVSTVELGIGTTAGTIAIQGQNTVMNFAAGADWLVAPGLQVGFAGSFEYAASRHVGGTNVAALTTVFARITLNLPLRPTIGNALLLSFGSGVGNAYTCIDGDKNAYYGVALSGALGARIGITGGLNYRPSIIYIKVLPDVMDGWGIVPLAFSFTF